MPREIYGPRAPLTGRVQPVIKGGTGADNLVDAPVSLGLIDNTKKGVDNGVVGLDSAGKLPTAAFPLTLGVNSVNVNGTFSLGIGTTSTFQITDYDSFRTYSVSASAGVVSISSDTITYVAPATAQAVTMLVNGRSIPIVVTLPIPATPTITSPVNGASSISPNGASLTGSAFVNGGDGATHNSSDWQIASDPGFNTIVSQSIGDTANKTTWTSGTLLASAVHYARVRYRASTGVYSGYSSTVSFTTSSVFSGVEEAKIVAADKGASNQLGSSVSLSSDGARVAIGSPATSPGSVYVFTRSGTTWTLEQKVQPVSGGGSFGITVAMTPDGTRFVAGSTTDTAKGALFIFLRTGTTWAQEGKVVPSSAANGDNFGTSVSITDDGTRVAGNANTAGYGAIFSRSGSTWTQETVITPDPGFGLKGVALSGDGLRTAFGSDANGTGKAMIYSRSGTTWTLEKTLVPTDTVQNGQFGSSVSFTTDGSRIAVGAAYYDAAVINAGAVYIFLRSGTNWTQEQKLQASDGVAGDFFGKCVSLGGDGSRIAIGAYQATSGGLTQCGKAYTFTRSGVTWTQGAILTASDKAASDAFGTSIALSGDNTRIAVGVPGSDPGGTSNAGAAYIYR